MSEIDQQFTLFIPSEEYEEELQVIAEENGGIFNSEPESNITAELMCSIGFGLFSAMAAISQILLQYQSLKNEKVILVTPKGVFRNITLEQAKSILQEYTE